jgi:hypothetical protein
MFGWIYKFKSWWRGDKPVERVPAPSPCRLERIVLAEGVARTLFDGFTEHRQSPRGDEEIGWILMGLRQDGVSIALAALPAGSQRDAGHAHIQFNSDAQELASRIVRQKDKRLQIVAVVHTHPGSLRTPSGGDFQGDSQWVSQLRGEAAFGIGTADVRAGDTPRDHRQVLGSLGFSWYALGIGDRSYRELKVAVTNGPDLALPMQPIWNVIETFAQPINNLCRQLAKVELEVISSPPPPGEGRKSFLSVKISLAEPSQKIRVLLNDSGVQYYWDKEGGLIAIDPHESQPDRAVYLILAQLAKVASAEQLEATMWAES